MATFEQARYPVIGMAPAKGHAMLLLFRYLHGEVPGTLDEANKALDAAERKNRALANALVPPAGLTMGFDCSYCGLVPEGPYSSGGRLRRTLYVWLPFQPARLYRVRAHEGCPERFFGECKALAAWLAEVYLALRAGHAKPGSPWRLLPRELFDRLWCRYVLPRLIGSE
jgi:hypothetical protein